MTISRFHQNLETLFNTYNILFIYGPKQVGKTTIVKTFLSGKSQHYCHDSGLDIRTQQQYRSFDRQKITTYISNFDLIIIDNAQHIPNIYWAIDQMLHLRPTLQIIAISDSNFADNNSLILNNDKKKDLMLFPVSQIELSPQHYRFELKSHIENSLIYGGYPEVLQEKNKQQKEKILSQIVGSDLLENIISLKKIRHTDVLLHLLKTIAFLIGTPLSYRDLAAKLNINYKTAQTYLGLLEKNFVIFSLPGFSRKLKKEIDQKKKYYFYDNGIRNSIIQAFNPLDLRNDHHQLWENFLMSERLKKLNYKKINKHLYFWQTWDRKNIHLIEEDAHSLSCFQFQWGSKTTPFPPLFFQTYQNDHRIYKKVINEVNYLDFCT